MRPSLLNLLLPAPAFGRGSSSQQLPCHFVCCCRHCPQLRSRLPQWPLRPLHPARTGCPGPGPRGQQLPGMRCRPCRCAITLPCMHKRHCTLSEAAACCSRPRASWHKPQSCAFRWCKQWSSTTAMQVISVMGCSRCLKLTDMHEQCIMPLPAHRTLLKDPGEPAAGLGLVKHILLTHCRCRQSCPRKTCCVSLSMRCWRALMCTHSICACSWRAWVSD